MLVGLLASPHMHLLPGDRVAYLGPVPGAYCGLRCVRRPKTGEVAGAR